MKLERTQCVYVIHNPEINITKIGISDNAERRLKDLQNASGCELVLFYNTEHLHNAIIYESMAHKALAEKRRVGEWFNVSPEEAVSVVNRVTENAPKDAILSEYKSGASISKIASTRGVSRQAIISRLSSYGIRIAGNGISLKPNNKPQKWRTYNLSSEHLNPCTKYFPRQPTPVDTTENNVTKRRVPKELFIDGDSVQLPLFKFKRIEPNINYNGEWYQTSFYSEGEFCYGYTKDLEKARQYISDLKHGKR